jgi:cytidylate kinase
VIIAVDGPAASGKGTLARRLAAHFGLRHLDTGALYRAVARDLLAAGGDLGDVAAATEAARGLDPATLDDPALRTDATGEAASLIAQYREVRAALVAFQRDFAASPPGAVLDGRDIGTVICPDADVKIYVVASVEERARRRWRELEAAGGSASFDDVLADLVRRDDRDSARADAPLKPAQDAHLLDTSNLDIEAAFRAAVELIEAATGRAD